MFFRVQELKDYKEHKKDSISAAKVYKLKGGIQHYGNTVGAEGWKVELGNAWDVS